LSHGFEKWVCWRSWLPSLAHVPNQHSYPVTPNISQLASPVQGPGERTFRGSLTLFYSLLKTSCQNNLGEQTHLPSSKNLQIVPTGKAGLQSCEAA